MRKFLLLYVGLTSVLSFFSISHANAQTLTTSTTVVKDYCSVPNEVVLTLNKLPSTATNINWHEIDNANVTDIIATGVTKYISKIAATYYATFVDNGTTYKTAKVSTGDELVMNGDFEWGATTAAKNAFFTEYTYGIGAAKRYSILQNATDFYKGFKGKYDHTKGDGTGYFMVVDGASDLVVWQQTISVQPNTTYYLSAWALKVYSARTDTLDNPTLGFSVNKEDIGTRVSLSKWTNKDANPWLDEYRFYATWYSGSATTAVVEIENYNSSSSGNDFGLDDISFGTFAPPAIDISGLNGNDAVCEGTPLSITANVSNGCSDQFKYEWINYTNLGEPTLESDNEELILDYPTNAQHGGEWKLVVRDNYSSDTLNFTLTLESAPNINITTSCITKKADGTENKDGSIFISGESNIECRLLNDSGNELESWSNKRQYNNLPSGGYRVEARYSGDENSCVSTIEVELSSDMVTLLPPDAVCQNTHTNITVVPSLCCYSTSEETTFEKGETSSNTYNTYVAGNEVSYRQVGIFQLNTANDELMLNDDGKNNFTYSVYKYPFNPAYPDENYITTVETKENKPIEGLTPGLVYVIVANAPDTDKAKYSELEFANVRKMTTASFPTVRWYSEASGGEPVATGETVSTETLGIDTRTPGTYDYYVTCCENGCSRDLVSVVVNPVPKLISGQTICSGSSTNIRPEITDINGNEIDTDIFPIEYKWKVLSLSGVTGATSSDYFQEDMNQTISLEDDMACGEAKYELIARIGGTSGCESKPEQITIKIVNANNIGTLDNDNSCVEYIQAATWNELSEPDADIKEERPEYKRYKAKDKKLDFPSDDFPSDDCYADFTNDLQWWICADDTPEDQIYSGTGQPSSSLGESDEIRLELGEDKAAERTFTITYQLNIQCGNGLVERSKKITIRPRPTITKM
ncbi:MAG: hypothetical protein ACK5JS_00010 [Mangrovibacterium sp.]